MTLNKEPKAESLFSKFIHRRTKMVSSDDAVPQISAVGNGSRIESVASAPKSPQELAGLTKFTTFLAARNDTAWDALTDDDDDDDIDDDGKSMKAPAIALTAEEASVVNINNAMHINKSWRMGTFIIAIATGSIWGAAVGGVQTIAAVGLTTTGVVTGGIFVGIPLAVGGLAWYFLNKNRKKMVAAKKTLKESRKKKDVAPAKK